MSCFIMKDKSSVDSTGERSSLTGALKFRRNEGTTPLFKLGASCRRNECVSSLSSTKVVLRTSSPVSAFKRPIKTGMWKGSILLPLVVRQDYSHKYTKTPYPSIFVNKREAWK